MINLTRSLILGFALCAAAPAMAQTGHDNHDGHDHSAHAAAAPDMTVEGVNAPVAGDHIIGEASAPVTLIVFASVTCPHCADWFEKDWPVVKRDLVDTGRVKVVFREFPTPPMRVAVAGFLLADCGAEDTYFEAIEWQMANQTRIREMVTAGQEREMHTEVGANAGLSQTQVDACLTDKSGFDDLNATVTRARAAGLKSVPAMMINGVLHDSKDVSAAALSTAIARAELAP